MNADSSPEYYCLLQLIIIKVNFLFICLQSSRVYPHLSTIQINLLKFSVENKNPGDCNDSSCVRPNFRKAFQTTNQILSSWKMRVGRRAG